MHTYRQFIDGKFVDNPARDTFEDRNPVDGTTAAAVTLGTADDVDRAVIAARKALHGPWGKMSVDKRCDLLDRLAAGIEARHDDFLRAEIADTGKPVVLAAAIDIPRGAANFRIFAQLARSHGTESFPPQGPYGALNYAIRVPVGVVGVICPWNLPLLLMTWKVAPALACGNTLVIKPSEETPGTATLLAEVAAEIGLPQGVLNVVHGFGPDSVGEAMTTHPGIDAITFTGESTTGTHIMRAVAPTMKAISFELGGKNPAIIFEDADLEKAVAGTRKSSFTNAGQVCLCSERVYVHRSLFEPFVEKLAATTQKLKLGDPYDTKTTTGPLISPAHRDKVLGYYRLARDEGATTVIGGGIPDLGARFAGGSFIEPTILTGLSNKARCMQEEIFGPVCHVMPFDDEAEAVHLANDSSYGLAAAIWTENLSRAHRVASQLEVGIVWANTWFLRDLRTPFGGVKLSGIGREGGIHSLNFYSELRNVCIQL